MEIQDDVTHVIPPAPKTTRGSASFFQAGPDYMLYFNGCTVILRPYDNGPSLFINHISTVTSAKYSHGFTQIASIDEKGNLMIHDLVGKKLSQNKVIQAFYSGAKAIDWTQDNKRICVVGSMKNKFGKVIVVQTGVEVGQISAVSASLNTVSIRPQKPYKIAAGGDQFTLKFYDGLPFKFAHSKNSHKNFINHIKYSPDGKKFVSVGSDRKITIYDGLTGQISKQLQAAHEAGIMGLTWVDDDHFITCSSDKKLKKWNSSLELQATLNSNDDPKQLSLIDSFVVAVSYCSSSSKVYFVLLSGQIKQADKNLQKITNSFEGFTNPAKIIPITQEKGNALLLDSKGKILKINNQNSKMHRFLRKKLCYDKLLLDISLSQSGVIYYLTGDQQIITTDLKQSEQHEKIQQITIQGTRLILSIYDNKIACFKTNGVQIYELKNNKYEKVASSKLSVQPTFVYTYVFKINQSQPSSSCDLILVGNAKGGVQVFTVQSSSGSTKISHHYEFHSNSNKITYIQKHENNLYIGDSAGAIKVWRLSSLKQKPQIVTQQMNCHRLIVSSIFVHDGAAYTFSYDNSIIVWNTLKKFSRVNTFHNAHKHGILCAGMVGDKYISCGGDLLLKVHKF